MKTPRVNRAGTPLSAAGYVLCGVCRKAVVEISKDTAPEFARCRQHGEWAINRKEKEEEEEQ